jgi:hypothetical protein
MERVARLDRFGATPEAFTFKHRFASPGGGSIVEAGDRDVCRA